MNIYSKLFVLAVAIVLMLIVSVAILSGFEQLLSQERIATTPTFKATLYKISDNEYSEVVRVYGNYIYLITYDMYYSNWFRVLKIDPNTMSVIASVNESISSLIIEQARFSSDGYLYIAVFSYKNYQTYLYVYDTNLNRVALYNITSYFLNIGFNVNIVEVTDFEVLDSCIALTGYVRFTDYTYYGFVATFVPQTDSFASIYLLFSMYNGMAKINSTDILVQAHGEDTLYHVKLDYEGNIVSMEEYYYPIYGFRVFVVGNYVITDYIQVLDLSTFNVIYEYPLEYGVIVPIDSNKVVYIYEDKVGILYSYSYAIETSIGYGFGGIAGDIYNGKILLPYSESANIVILEEIQTTATPSTVTTTVTSATTTTITTTYITTIPTTITTTYTTVIPTTLTYTTTIVSPVPVYQTKTVTMTTAVGMAIETNIIIVIAMIILLAIGLVYALRRSR